MSAQSYRCLVLSPAAMPHPQQPTHAGVAFDVQVPTHPSVNILPPSISGPMWVRNLASTVSASLGLVSVSTSFINFSPCVAAINPAGVAVDAAAVNIEPTGAPLQA